MLCCINYYLKPSFNLPFIDSKQKSETSARDVSVREPPPKKIPVVTFVAETQTKQAKDKKRTSLKKSENFHQVTKANILTDLVQVENKGNIIKMQADQPIAITPVAKEMSREKQNPMSHVSPTKGNYILFYFLVCVFLLSLINCLSSHLFLAFLM